MSEPRFRPRPKHVLILRETEPSKSGIILRGIAQDELPTTIRGRVLALGDGIPDDLKVEDLVEAYQAEAFLVEKREEKSVFSVPYEDVFVVIEP